MASNNDDVVLHTRKDNTCGILGNDHHSGANKVSMAMKGYPKLVVIPIMRNQRRQCQQK